MNPGEEIAEFLEGVGIGLVLGVNMFVGPVRAESDFVPSQSVFVVPRNGRMSDRVFNLDFELQYPMVVIRVRSEDYRSGYDLARQIYHELQSQDVSFLDVRCIQSEPIFLEQDDNDNYQWQMNFEVMRRADFV